MLDEQGVDRALLQIADEVSGLTSCDCEPQVADACVHCTAYAAAAKAQELERSRCAQWARWWAMAHDYHAEYILPSRRRPERKKARRDRARDMAYKAIVCMLGTIEKGEDPQGAPRHIKDGPLLTRFAAVMEAGTDQETSR